MKKLAIWISVILLFSLFRITYLLANHIKDLERRVAVIESNTVVRAGEKLSNLLEELNK